MRVVDYLRAKYKTNRPTTMLHVEANVFRVPYPLEPGWLDRYGDRELDTYMAIRLQKLLEKSIKSKVKTRSDSAKVGLDVLNAAYLHLQSTVDPKSPEFLKSKAWLRVRVQALKSHGNRCQCCGASPQTGAVLNVDHIRPRRLFPELALDISNLQILCSDCNTGKGNWDMTDWRGE